MADRAPRGARRLRRRHSCGAVPSPSSAAALPSAGAGAAAANGAGLAAIWGSWARFVYKERADRFARFGHRVLGLPVTGDDLADAERAIESLLDFFREIDMPTTFAELGIHPTAEEISEMTVKATYFGKRTLGDVMVLGSEEIKAIFTDAAQR